MNGTGHQLNRRQLTFERALIKGSLSCILPAVSTNTTSIRCSLAEENEKKMSTIKIDYHYFSLRLFQEHRPYFCRMKMETIVITSLPRKDGSALQGSLPSCIAHGWVESLYFAYDFFSVILPLNSNCC